MFLELGGFPQPRLLEVLNIFSWNTLFCMFLLYFMNKYFFTLLTYLSQS